MIWGWFVDDLGMIWRWFWGWFGDDWGWFGDGLGMNFGDGDDLGMILGMIWGWLGVIWGWFGDEFGDEFGHDLGMIWDFFLGISMDWKLPHGRDVPQQIEQRVVRCRSRIQIKHQGCRKDGWVGIPVDGEGSSCRMQFKNGLVHDTFEWYPIR